MVSGSRGCPSRSPPVRAEPRCRRAGRAIVAGGTNLIARTVARIVGFPPAGDHDLHMAFAVHHGIESWARSFSGRSVRSRLSRRGDRLVERFGPLAFAFDLPSDDTGLRMVLRGW